MLEGFLSALGTLLVIVLILYLAWVATKLVGKSARFRQYAGSSRYLTVMDQAALGPEASIAVVKISGRFFLLGIAPKRISLLAELEDGEWADAPELPVTGPIEGIDFKEIMKKLKDRKK